MPELRTPRILLDLHRKYLHILGREASLSHRMLRGTGWVALSRLLVQISSLIQLAVVARFLSPSDIGLMAVVLLTLQVLETFTTPGFTQALIQRDGAVEAYFPSVFWTNILRGSLLSIVIFVAAPLIASFFRQPDAISVIRASAGVLTVRAFQSPAMVNVNRKLQFRRLTYLELLSAFAGLLTAIPLAVLLQNVWALILGMAARELMTTFGSYVAAPWKPRFQFDWHGLLDLYGFGRWVVLGNVVTFLSLQLDNIAVGRLLGTTSLGFYEIAFRISQLPATQISQTAATVAFPALSSVVKEPERFRRGYLRMTTTLLFVNIIVTVLLIVFAGQIVSVVLGPGWSETIPVLRILAFAGFLRSIVTVGGKVFYAAGSPKYDFMMNSARLIVFATIVYPMVRAYDLKGAALAVLISITSVIPFYFLFVRRTTGVSPQDHLAYIVSMFSILAGKLKRGSE